MNHFLVYPCATVYDSSGYTGPHTVIPNAAEEANAMTNSFSSVRVNPGCEFEIFEDSNFGGHTAAYPAELGQGVHEYEFGYQNIIGPYNWETLGIKSYKCRCGTNPEGIY